MTSIGFKRNGAVLGRHGYHLVCGLAVEKIGDRLVITPITSQGNKSRSAGISIPIEEAEALAAMLYAETSFEQPPVQWTDLPTLPPDAHLEAQFETAIAEGAL